MNNLTEEEKKKKLAEFNKKIKKNQEELPLDIQEMLYKNFWDLIDGEDKQQKERE